MITVSFQGTTIAEVQQHIKTYLGANIAEVQAVSTEPVKKTRKAREFKPEEPTEVKAPPSTLDACKEMLAKLSTTTNIDTAREALKHFGANRISELKDSDYAKFVSYCATLIPQIQAE